MKVRVANYALPKSGAVVVTALEDKKLLPAAQALDKQSGGALS